jgi:hypothetical protein
MLKLKIFLNRSPIFYTKCDNLQNIPTPYKKDNKVKSEKILTSKGIRSDRRKQRIKFNGNE